MESLLQDLRIGVRMLVRKPGFAVVAIATLGLGIGANVAVFTLVNAVLLRPLPVEAPERLVNVYTEDSTVEIDGFTLLPTSYRNYEDLRDHSEVFEALAFAAPIDAVLSDLEPPLSVSGYLTSANYFETLGVPPAMGRGFSPEEDGLGRAHAVVVLSDSLWTRQFGRDPNVIDSTIRLNHEPFTVIGVAPPGFRGTSTLVDADQVWVPTSAYEIVLSGVRRDQFLNRRGLFVSVFGRLSAGVRFDEARAHLEALGTSLAEQYPRDNANRSVAIGSTIDAAYGPTPYRGADESQQMRYAASILMSVSGLVLLIACVNLANLLLARGADREKEMSIRAELGATPRRLVQQLLSEALTLAALGGVVGIGIAAWGRDLLWTLRPPGIQEGVVDVSIDTSVLAFTFGVTLLTGILFGSTPAVLGARKKDLNATLKLGGRRGSTGESRSALRHALVATELALAFVALVASGLFVRSLTEAQSVDPGFEPDGLATAAIDLGASGYEADRGRAFYDELIVDLRAAPGIEHAALSQYAPIAISPFRALVPEGEVEDPTRFGPAVTVNVVSDGYLETLGATLVDGRTIESRDRADTRPVTIVTRALAERFWPGENALGRRFRFAGADTFYEIVGVVEDTVVRNVLDDPAPVAYFPLRQRYLPGVVVTVRGSSAELALATTRQRLRARDASVAVTNESVVSDALAEGLWAPKVGAALLGLFGILALVLAAVGVYGVLAYAVSRRTQEVGVRLVFGASRAQIYGLLIRQGMTPALIGLAVGVVAALALARHATTLLFRVSPYDSTTFAATFGTLAAVALAACLLSIRRAARLEPMNALRED